MVSLETESRTFTGRLKTSDGANIQITLVPAARKCCSLACLQVQVFSRNCFKFALICQKHKCNGNSNVAELAVGNHHEGKSFKRS